MLASPCAASDAARLADALRTLPWPGCPNRPPIELATMDSLEARAALDRPDHAAPLVYVVVCQGASGNSDGGATLDRFREVASVDSTPIVAIGCCRAACPTESPTENPIIALPPDTTPEIVAATLSGLLARQADVDRLSRELTLTGRVADGVQSELTRIDEELQMAAILQQEFLPKTPSDVEGVEFGALWRPAGSVSGDVYEIARLDERHVGLFLADAVGHGVPAALMAMQLCRALETRDHHDRFRRLVPPSEALARLNALMADRQGRVGRYASAIYALVDCRERVMRVACAGGPPPVLIAPNGDVRLVPARGPLLGLVPTAEFEESVVELGPEDLIVLHSDGLEQAFHDDGELFAPPSIIPRHLDELARLRSLNSCEAAIDAVARKLDGEEGSLHPSDDCTLLVMRAHRRAA
ncbi:MAG: serine/threonine-protein phosphatase [Phycisphaerae bacterium]|nr:serine/threonine-protein phosphatase [Phycisphaerae bacterium]